MRMPPFYSTESCVSTDLPGLQVQRSSGLTHHLDRHLKCRSPLGINSPTGGSSPGRWSRTRCRTSNTDTPGSTPPPPDPSGNIVEPSSVSNAMFFRIVRVGRADYIPLGLVAPIAIFVGLAGSKAIRPLHGEAKNAALAEEFVGAVVILAFLGLFALWFRRWQSGNPYG